MKTTITTIIATFLLVVNLFAQSVEIQRIGKDKQYAFIDNGWRKGAKCIKVRFAVDSDTAGSKLKMKAYFFDSTGNIVYTLNAPSHVSDANLNTSAIPQNLEGDERYTVFFAIPERFDRGSKKWRRCVVVLANENDTVAMVYPTDDIANFNFPEKSILK